MKWEIVRIKIGESNNIIKKIVTNEKDLTQSYHSSRFIIMSVSRDTSHKYTAITPGVEWLDTNNEKINAHGGGILYHEGIYYWYGECKSDSTYWNPNVPGWECYRTEAGGVNCYSSKDLLNWKYEGLVLQPEISDTQSDLHPSKVLERPKVIYKTKPRNL